MVTHREENERRGIFFGSCKQRVRGKNPEGYRNTNETEEAIVKIIRPKQMPSEAINSDDIWASGQELAQESWTGST
ncbi:hypothetical protein Zmor_015977 [Zophobas morio]|uniref:Uncharacterized protein n=1 Tax=Zophobas morio TaxID=2755281 RepID=A0AA38MI21_9CUCU|nr:hypothetical protein Zmor_015977 [Zophobas morio]